MIKSVKVTSGYGSKLPNLRGRTFTFTPGLNVLFGPNGCGKSTLINIMAGYCFCGGDGWTRLYTGEGGDRFANYDIKGVVIGDNPKPFPDLLQAKGCSAEVDWDGTPTLFNSTLTDAPVQVFGMSGMSMEEEVLNIMNKSSDGERRIQRVGRVVDMLKKEPNLLTKYTKGDLERKFTDYIKSLPRTGPNTVLMDEPDRSMSAESQTLLWAMLPRMAVRANVQIILASHSFLLLFGERKENTLKNPLVGDENINIIDVAEGFHQYSQDCLKYYANGLSHAELAGLAKLKRDEDAKNNPLPPAPKEKEEEKPTIVRDGRPDPEKTVMKTARKPKVPRVAKPAVRKNK